MFTMPSTEYTPPPYVLTDTNVASVLKESLDRAILTRQNILEKPKPTYDIDGQRFEWAEYLEVLNKTIAQLTKELQDIDGPFEVESVGYSL